MDKVKGADPSRLKTILEKLGNEIESAGEGGGASGNGGMTWLGADLPRGYSDISDIIDIRGLELLNADTEFSVRTLFNKPKPAALSKGSPEVKDWVESDTDEQLLLFMPFNSAVKLHTIQVYNHHYQVFPAANPEHANEIVSRLPLSHRKLERMMTRMRYP